MDSRVETLERVVNYLIKDEICSCGKPCQIYIRGCDICKQDMLYCGTEHKCIHGSCLCFICSENMRNGYNTCCFTGKSCKIYKKIDRKKKFFSFKK